VSTGSALDARELLQLLAEQQASLVRLQQLVVEHVLSESQLDPSTVNTSSAPAASDLVAAIDASNVFSPAYERPSDTEVVRSTEPEQAPAALASTPAESGALVSDPLVATPQPPKKLPSPSPSPAPTASADSPFGDAPPEQAGATTPADRFASTPAAANSRAGRYLKPPASAPAKQVTNQELYRLSSLRDVGDVAQLVLQFGEYRGATLFQVAQSDPDYLRSLALTAQRPQVRAAAMQLVRALEASPQAPVRRRTPKTNSRRNGG
jgi:hypothetical protein